MVIAKRIVLLYIFIFSSIYTFSQSPCQFTPGYKWKGKLKLNDSIDLPFYFQLIKVKNLWNIEIYNAEEVINVTEVRVTQDSLVFKMPVFNSEFLCRWKTIKEKNDALEGEWVNHNREIMNTIPFSAKKEYIKPIRPSECKSFEGKWEVEFGPGTTASYKAIGKFRDPKCWDRVYGTFLTETGDYRYLSGNTYHNGANEYMILSCFDGSHAFCFKAAKQADGSLVGEFYSGRHGYENWIAKRNDEFQLVAADSITQFKLGRNKLQFSFPNTSGKYISADHILNQKKVVVIQIMGSWCPNCMDESVMLQSLYKKYQSAGLEVVAMAFEKTKDTALARPRVERFRKHLGCTYPFLVTGLSGKEEASKCFPMLSEISAFPTTIYIDRNGQIRKVYTGFSGPGTGEYYQKTLIDIERLIQQLLSEQ